MKMGFIQDISQYHGYIKLYNINTDPFDIIGSVLIRDLHDRNLSNCTVCYLSAFNIKQKYRQNGCAKLLMERVIKLFGQKPIKLDAKPYGNEPRISMSDLVKFYESHGFAQTETQYYHISNEVNYIEMLRKPSEN